MSQHYVLSPGFAGRATVAAGLTIIGLVAVATPVQADLPARSPIPPPLPTDWRIPPETVRELTSLVDRLQLTGRKDNAGKGPPKQDQSEIPSNTSGCDFLGSMLVLDTPFSAGQFARARASIEKTSQYKSQSLSGIGDEAYLTWDPRPGTRRSVHLSFSGGEQADLAGGPRSARFDRDGEEAAHRVREDGGSQGEVIAATWLLRIFARAQTTTDAWIGAVRLSSSLIERARRRRLLDLHRRSAPHLHTSVRQRREQNELGRCRR